MDRKILFVVLSGLIYLTSCIGGAATPDNLVYTLLPGECLADTVLTYRIPDSVDQIHVNDRFIFQLRMNFNKSCEKTDARTFRMIPTDDTFKSFGEDEGVVRNEYEKEYTSFHEQAFQERPVYYYVTTILYNGGISLVANKDFAGYPAGENLGEALVCHPVDETHMKDLNLPDPVVAEWFNSVDHAGSFLDIPRDYISLLGKVVYFSIPMNGRSIVDDHVTFQLDVPVRVVLYLEWLRDKFYDPDAPVPYRDVVLHSTFTTTYGVE